jgi:hypothetical protein
MRANTNCWVTGSISTTKQSEPHHGRIAMRSTRAKKLNMWRMRPDAGRHPVSSAVSLELFSIEGFRPVRANAEKGRFKQVNGFEDKWAVMTILE